jgi:hypothetical protein
MTTARRGCSRSPRPGAGEVVTDCPHTWITLTLLDDVLIQECCYCQAQRASAASGAFFVEEDGPTAPDSACPRPRQPSAASRRPKPSRRSP